MSELDRMSDPPTEYFYDDGGDDYYCNHRLIDGRVIVAPPCPTCNGSGEYADVFNEEGDFDVVKCAPCNGSGYHPDTIELVIRVDSEAWDERKYTDKEWEGIKEGMKEPTQGNWDDPFRAAVAVLDALTGDTE